MEKNKAKNRNGIGGKRGFTLVELSVALALLAILTAMIVSFSVLVSGYAEDGRSVADRVEDCTQAKEAILSYVRARDVQGASFAIAEDSLSASDGSSVSFADGTLTLGAITLTGLDTLDSITFDQSGKKIIRVTLNPKEEENAEAFTLVLALRWATIPEEGGS